MEASAEVVDRWRRLTPREKDVMNALVNTDGSNNGMSAVLGITPTTVGTHISTIMLKADIHSRVELAVAWVRDV